MQISSALSLTISPWYLRIGFKELLRSIKHTYLISKKKNLYFSCYLIIIIMWVSCSILFKRIRRFCFVSDALTRFLFFCGTKQISANRKKNGKVRHGLTPTPTSWPTLCGQASQPGSPLGPGFSFVEFLVFRRWLLASFVDGTLLKFVFNFLLFFSPPSSKPGIYIIYYIFFFFLARIFPA